MTTFGLDQFRPILDHFQIFNHFLGLFPTIFDQFLAKFD
jgi:hypothetical protein